MSPARRFREQGTLAQDLLFYLATMSDQPTTQPTPPPTPVVLRPMVPVTRLVSRPSVQIVDGRLVVLLAVAERPS